jgi:hypothetical protein
VFYTSNLVVVDFLKGPDVLLSIGNSYWTNPKEKHWRPETVANIASGELLWTR